MKSFGFIFIIFMIIFNSLISIANASKSNDYCTHPQADVECSSWCDQNKVIVVGPDATLYTREDCSLKQKKCNEVKHEVSEGRFIVSSYCK
jgi:hypothetical protein